MEAEFSDHLERINKRLAEGRATLRALHSQQPVIYAVPDATSDTSVIGLDPPHDDDKYVFFFLLPLAWLAVLTYPS